MKQINECWEQEAYEEGQRSKTVAEKQTIEVANSAE